MNKNNCKGFTLLELLVVVLIIGILAAIALPQYKLAVGKAKFAELKASSHGIVEALQRHYLVHGTYEGSSRENLDIEIPQTISCFSWVENPYIRCCKNIFNTQICLYRYKTGQPYSCYAYSTNQDDVYNRICQSETGNKTPKTCLNEDFCQYLY